MSEMSSFYGGRQGSPFIIVKRFDGIDIPQTVENPVYTNRSYAMDEVDTNLFKLVTREQGGNVPVDEANNVYLIGKNGLNKRDYTFKNHFNDGSQINDTAYHFPTKLAEGMVQCFAKGAKSASEVNYGEYVLIDTVEEVNDYVNPDNGKVFRRGMNIDSELAGAEYIGCIVGPKGETIELKYGHYEDIYNQPHTGDGQYDIDHDDLVFGSYIDEVSGERVYEDAIKYAYVTLVDEYNNVIGSLIGFKIPTLVEDYEAQSMSPYEQRAVDPVTGKYYNYDLISPDPTQYINNEWQHSYYQKWQIKVPHGYHGIDCTNLEVVPTKTMPQGFKADDFEGTKYYSDKELTELVGTFTTAQNLNLDTYEADANWIEVTYEGNPVYVAKDDCYMDMFRYKETRYENLEEGEVEYFLIGYVDTIQRVAVSPNGVITVYYRGDNQYESLDTYVQWLDDVDIQTSDDSDIEGTGDQRIHLTFNTLDEHGEHNTKAIGEPLNYIIETAISIPNNEHPDVPYCHLLVYYADPALRALYQDKWVTYPSSKYPGQTWTEWVDIGLVRGVAGGLHIVKDVQSIDELIDSQGNHIPPERLEDENDHVINPEAAGWSCSLTVWTYVESVSTNPNSLQIVPNGTSPLGERQIEIGDVEELNPGEFHVGDYVLKEKAKPTEILFYDYELKTWYSIGALDMSAVDPRYIIVKSTPQPGTQEPYFLDVELLSTHGIWLSAEKGISAY